MEKVVILAEFVSINCFIGTKNLLFDTFSIIRSTKGDMQQNNTTKIVFMIFNLNLKEYTTFYKHLKQSYSEEFKQYFINILMAKNRADAEENIEHIHKVNQPEFEYNYFKLQEHSERALPLEIVESYINAKFKWNKVKAKYFLEKNHITSIKDMLQYNRFPLYEKSIIEKTKQFKEYCQAAITIAEDEKL